MYNTDMPSRQELPSSAQLIRSTVIAAVVAAVLLVTVVMPAEYALDPTGVGRWLGLTEMGEIKGQLAAEAAAEEAALQESSMPEAYPISEAGAQAPDAESTEALVAVTQPATISTVEEPEPEVPVTEPQWKDEIRVVLTPGEGTEYKLVMQEGAVARYAWVSEGGPINYDTHGDAKGKSISYKKGRGVPEEEGQLVAAFTGNHGWFFRNRNDANITLILRTGGDYQELKRMK